MKISLQLHRWLLLLLPLLGLALGAKGQALGLANIEQTTLTYTSGALQITSALTVTSSTSATLTGATVQFTSGFQPQDRLLFTNQNGITGSYNTSTGVLVLNGTSTIAAYQTAFRSITYQNASSPVSSGTRQVQFSATDGSATSNTQSRSIAVQAASAATVTTSAVGSITTSSAVLGGNVTADGGATVTGRGVVYSPTSTNGTPTIGGSGVMQAANGSGTGAFSATISGLNPSTSYSVQAYATNSAGTSYGGVQTFTTSRMVATSKAVTVQLAANGTATLQASDVNNGSTGSGTLTYTIQKIVFSRVPENNTLTLSTPNGANFTAIRFASFGTPSDDGNGNYRMGSCNAAGQSGTANSVTKAQNAYVGQSSGSLLATNNYSDGSTNFGDPCSGTTKYLAVQAAYSADAASQSYACVEAGKTQYVLLTVTDSNGNSSTATAKVTVVAPPAISISSVSPSAAQRGATVTVAGTNLDGIGSTVTVNGASASVSNLTASGFSFVVPNTATIGAGNLTLTAPCSQTLNAAFTVQQAQTAAPTLSVAGNIPNGQPTFSGTAPAGSALVITVQQGSTTVQTISGVTATSSGSYSYTVPAGSNLAPGSYTASATAQSSGSSVSATSNQVAFTVTATGPATVLTSTASNPTSTAPIPVTVAFSRNVTGFSASSVAVRNSGGSATVSNFTAVDGKTYTFGVTPSATGLISVSVPAGAAQDSLSRNNQAAATLTRQYNQPATATPVITAPATNSYTNQNVTISGTAPASSSVTLYLSQNGGAFQPATPSNASASGTFSFGSVSFPDGTYQMYATAQSQYASVSPNSATTTFTVDTSSPSVTISSSAGASGSSTSTSPIPFTVTFSESVTGFGQGDLTVTGGAVSGFSGSGATYTFSVTPASSTTVTVSVAAGVAQDAAGNGNTASSPYSLAYTAPTATVTAVTGQTPSPTATAQVSYTVTFSTAVSGLTASNFSVAAISGNISGASVATVVGSGTTYTVTVNTGTGEGTLRLNVTSSAGLTPSVTNVPYTSGTTYAVTRSFAAAPTLRLQGAGSASGNSDVTAFVDVVQVLSNGSAVSNALQNNSFENNNVAPGSFLYQQNVVASPWSFGPQAGVSRNRSGFGSTAYSGDAVALLQSTSGNNGYISQSLAVPTGSSYQVSFRAIQRNYTALDQRLNVFVNDVFVGSLQPNNIPTYDTFTSATFSVAAPALTATVSTTSGSPTSTSPIPYSVSFSQSVGTSFTAADVTVAGGMVNTASFSGSGAGPYTFTVTPNGAGTVTVSVTANVANDANNTGNSATNSVSVQFQAPTITVAPASLPGGTQGTAYSTTFSASGGAGSYAYAVSGTLPNGLTLTGNTLSGTPTAAGTYSFRLTATDNSAAPGPYSGYRDYTLTIAAPVVTAVSWTGAVSTDWFAAANWSPAQVPDVTIDALIPTAPSGNRFPFVSSGTASARNLSISSGATLGQTGGTLTLAANLTNNGTYQPTGGTLALGGSAQSNLFGSGNTRFWNLTVGASGAQSSTSASTSVQQVLTLNGNFATNGNPFTLESSASGTALVVNQGSSVVTGNVTVQRYLSPALNPGLGYHHYAAPISTATVASLTTASYAPVVNPAYNTSATPARERPFPTVLGYDQARLASTTNDLDLFTKGWYSPASTSDALSVGQGYALNLSAGQALAVRGPLNNGDLSVALARNSGATAADAGLALVGNPYPAPLDWSQVDPADRPGLDGVLYVFQSTSQYGGQYRSYVNNVGGDPVVAQGQGFFVRVTPGQTSGQLTFRNAQRLTTYQNPAVYRPAETRPLVQLQLQGSGTPYQDNAYVYFQAGATAGLDAEFDALKLANSTGLNLSTSLPARQQLSIDGRPALGTTQLVVPLAVGVPAPGSYSLTAAQLLNLRTTPTYLRDLQTGAVVDLAQQPSYQFTVGNASSLLTGRFELVFSPQQPLAASPAVLAQQVALYPNPATGTAYVELPASLGRQAVTAVLVDAVGRQVRALTLPAQGAVAHPLDLHELPTGVYTLHLHTSAGTVVKRLTVE